MNIGFPTKYEHTERLLSYNYCCIWGYVAVNQLESVMITSIYFQKHLQRAPFNLDFGSMEEGQ